jgi:hypothetical protein
LEQQFSGKGPRRQSSPSPRARVRDR